MFNPEKLLGGLLRENLGRGSKKIKGGVAMGLLGVAMEAFDHFVKQPRQVSPPPPPSGGNSPVPQPPPPPSPSPARSVVPPALPVSPEGPADTSVSRSTHAFIFCTPSFYGFTIYPTKEVVLCLSGI